MTETIFSKIIRKEIPAEIVYEDEKHLAFLDIAPFEKGHTLVIPKKHYSFVHEMPEDEYLELQKVVLKLVKHYEAIFNKKIGILVHGLEVPHVHFHIYPITEDFDVLQLQNRKKYNPNEAQNYAKELRL